MTTPQIEAELMSMTTHECLEYEDFSVLRVIGGWIYTIKARGKDGATSLLVLDAWVNTVPSAWDSPITPAPDGRDRTPV